MEDQDQNTNAIELYLCGTEDVIDLLIFIHQEGEPAERARLNSAILTLLHAATHRLKTIDQRLHGTAA
ncbi:hypothetical protein [Mesorhizobium sp. B2-3-4]|uniref:hypothetical protein n=1 Tax=Mesorhizobium sp. B2-3-4 TaxID=2589959 RepID=UPI001125D2CB|nr:hypothetical protein [Mesorhizobium sp. B2-3-4]TPM37522.1 hypothetical protein FJ967_15995 [Mesorhizobium sp. B2-3-4]